MAASGSAWIKPKKRGGLRPDALTNLPHPRFVRTGQRCFPLGSRAKTVVTLRVVRVHDAQCELRREDHERRTVRVRTDRLLAAGEAGEGVHFRFIGHAPRAAYRTHAVVIEVDGAWTRIVCPEWHPRVPITVATRALVPELRGAGTWLACSADLGAAAAARVSPHRFAPVGSDFDASVHHPVNVEARSERSDAPTPELGEGCGDIVLFLGPGQLEEARANGPGVYVTGHPPPVNPGARAYLHADGEVRGWREVRAVRRLPNGVKVALRGRWHAVSVEADLRIPRSRVAGGAHGRQLWAWRSWPLNADRSRRS